MHQVAKDISGHGNDLPLVTPPQRKDLVIDKVRSQRHLLRAWAHQPGPFNEQPQQPELSEGLLAHC